MSFATTYSQNVLEQLPRTSISIQFNFMSISFQFKRGFLPPWRKMCSSSKTAKPIKQNFSLWTKLLENLLLAKNLISVPAALNRRSLASSITYTLRFPSPNFRSKPLFTSKPYIFDWAEASISWLQCIFSWLDSRVSWLQSSILWLISSVPCFFSGLVIN